MKVVFRADASLQIGTGHIMRCLTLADALRRSGANCTFISRSHRGHLLELINQRGHTTVALATHPWPQMDTKSKSPRHAAWLGTDWASDADETQLALDLITPDWLIVDHYALDIRWEKKLRSHCRRLMVIDDLADREHDCDLLLDQNLGRSTNDYLRHIPCKATALIGSRYALLRPEFVTWREKSLARRKNPRLERILITMGGVDENNATEQVLKALCKSPLAPNVHITVVMGHHAPWQSNIKELATQMPWNTEVLINVDNMAELMSESDLAIGASGSTNWERCCLGLPSLIVVLAENQKTSAIALHKTGAALLLHLNNMSTYLPEIIKNLSQSKALEYMSHAALTLTNGDGVIKVISEMEKKNHYPQEKFIIRSTSGALS